MQGTAADLIKLSMVEVQRVLDAEKRGTKMIMQVRHEIPCIMAGVAHLRVPLRAEVEVGPNWDTAH